MRAGMLTRTLFVVLAMAASGFAAARAELIDNGDGTITDTVSGLMWLKNTRMSGTGMTFQQANDWAGSLEYAGHSDWRLPSGANRDGSGAVCNSEPYGYNCTQTEFATLYFARLIMFGNPGPFENLAYGSYWTSTELPGDPTRAMAQDFVDGGQNPYDKQRTFPAWAVRDAGPVDVPLGTPLLFGVVSQGQNAGALVQIDTQNAAVSIVGPTGFPETCGLAFDRVRMKLYLNPCFGPSGLQVIGTSTAEATAMSTQATGVRSIAYRSVDDRLYGVDLGPTLLSLDAETGGSSVEIVGMIDKESVAGIAARPSDGQLFGVGRESGIQKLFKLKHSAGPGARDVDVATVAGSPLTSITFHPDGRLFGTDGGSLVTLDPVTGAVLSRHPFLGAPIGKVGALAVTGPRIPLRMDAWLKDCLADDGRVPSSPSPCATWTRSPDIMIDNNGDGTADPLRPGQTNLVRVTVRNRGPGSASGVVVRLIALTPRPGAPPYRFSLIGERVLGAQTPPGRSAQVVIPWQAPAGVQASSSCLAVVLDHPSDRPLPGPAPTKDNNKAVRCFGQGLWLER